MQKEFDEVLLRLAHEKSHLDIAMVSADIKHITQFEEMILLKEFEKSETTYTSRYRTKKKEREAMAVKVKSVPEAARGRACVELTYVALPTLPTCM